MLKKKILNTYFQHFKIFLSSYNRTFKTRHFNKGHVIITGTGRAGTTYLTHLLTALGLDTGFKLDNVNQFINDNAKAGLELDVRAPNAPFICKSPWFSEYAVEVLNQIKINHVIIPVRDFHDAAASRVRVTQEYQKKTGSQKTDGIDGGLVFTSKPEEQLPQLQAQFLRLIQILADYHVPVTFISFPRFAHDPEYLYKKLSFLLKDITYKKFLEIYNQITHTELIHQFNKDH